MARTALAEDIVVFDTDACSMTVTGFSGNGQDGFAMDVLYQNKTDDTTIMFSIDNTALNGWMVSGLEAEEVTPGNTAVERVSWSERALKGYDLDDITQVSFALRAYDSDDWSADELVEDVFEIYPQDEDAFAQPAYELETDDVLLVDDDNLTVAVIGYEGDGKAGFTTEVFVENKTDATLMVSTDLEALNGWMASPFWADEITPHKCAIEQIEWGRSALEDLGLADIVEVRFSMRVYDTDDWFADNYLDEAFTLHPQGEDAVQEFPREPLDTDEVLVDNDSVTVTLIGSGPGRYSGYDLAVYLENKTDATVMFSVDSAAVNGVMCDPYWAKELAPHTKAITTIDWGSYSLDDAGIEADAIADIQLDLRAYDSDDWFSGDLMNETVDLSV